MAAKKSAPPADADEPSLEALLAEIEATVRSLESGTLSLDDSLACYERGVQLIVMCKRMLDNAEQRVKLLLGVNEDGSPKEAPFETNEGAGAQLSETEESGS